MSLLRGEISKASIAIYVNYVLKEPDSFKVARHDRDEKKNRGEMACLKKMQSKYKPNSGMLRY
jgi:hypothetical protein